MVTTSPTSQAVQNYADALQMNSFGLPVVFAAIYFLLLGAFLYKASKNPTYVLWVTAFFCLVRIVAFVMRAVLARVDSAGRNFDLVLAQQIIYGAGFFGVLYAAFIIVLDRGIIKGTNTSLLSRITGNRTIIRLALIIAVSLSVTGAILTKTTQTMKSVKQGKQVKFIGIIMFLVVACFLIIHTVLSIVTEFRKVPDEKEHSSLPPHGLYNLLIVGVLLAFRESFFVVTANNMSQYDERMFYPFAVCTELAAVLMFLAPGIVPLKTEVAEAIKRNEYTKQWKY